MAPGCRQTVGLENRKTYRKSSKLPRPCTGLHWPSPLGRSSADVPMMQTDNMPELPHPWALPRADMPPLGNPDVSVQIPVARKNLEDRGARGRRNAERTRPCARAAPTDARSGVRTGRPALPALFQHASSDQHGALRLPLPSLSPACPPPDSPRLLCKTSLSPPTSHTAGTAQTLLRSQCQVRSRIHIQARTGAKPCLPWPGG